MRYQLDLFKYTPSVYNEFLVLVKAAIGAKRFRDAELSSVEIKDNDDLPF